jgi:hypothetical protein
MAADTEDINWVGPQTNHAPSDNPVHFVGVLCAASHTFPPPSLGLRRGITTQH